MQERADQFARFDLRVALDVDAAAAGRTQLAEPPVIASLDLVAIPRPAEFPILRGTIEEAVAGPAPALRKNAAADQFSGAVLVAKDGRVLVSRAYGQADRERDREH